MLHGMSCMFHGVCPMLIGANRSLHGVCRMFHGACCSFLGMSRMLKGVKRSFRGVEDRLKGAKGSFRGVDELCGKGCGEKGLGRPLEREDGEGRFHADTTPSEQAAFPVNLTGT